MERTKALIVNRETKTAYLVIPIEFINALKWEKADKIFIALYDDRIELSKTLPKLAGQSDLIDINSTNLNKSVIRGCDSYRLWFRKELVENLQILENNLYNIILQDERIIMKKIEV